MAASIDTKRTRGGEFAIRAIGFNDVFIPEQFDEEQKMIAGMAKDFLSAEVIPHLDRIDKQEPGLMESLIEKSGELGLLGTSIPEAYGGFGKEQIGIKVLVRRSAHAVRPPAERAAPALPRSPILVFVYHERVIRARIPHGSRDRPSERQESEHKSRGSAT